MWTRWILLELPEWKNGISKLHWMVYMDGMQSQFPYDDLNVMFQFLGIDYFSFFQKNMGCTDGGCTPLLRTQAHCPCMCFFWGYSLTILKHHACFFLLIKSCYWLLLLSFFCPLSSVLYGDAPLFFLGWGWWWLFLASKL